MVVEVEVNQQWKVVGRVPSEFGVGDSDVADGQSPTREGLIERGHRPVGRK